MNGKQKKRKLLIYLTGAADSPFFYNEIQELAQAFDKVYVITYGDDPGAVKQIEDKYKIKISMVKLGMRSLMYCPAVFGMLFSAEIRDEWKWIHKKYFGKRKILCIGYALYYILFAACASRKLKKILEENRGCDVYLYSFWMSKAAFSLGMFDYKKYPDVKSMVARAHGYDLYEERNRAGYLPFRKLIAERLDKILFISEDGKRYFQRYLKGRHLQGNGMDVIHMGVSNSSYMKRYQAKDEMVIASCSSVVDVKRLDLIIDFLQILSSKIKTRWIHLGDGKLMGEIKQQADRKLSNMQVLFMGGVDNKKILEIYEDNDIDFFINMSDSEGIPVSIMEAFSAGIPVIARDVGGNSEIVNGCNGFLLEGLDRKDLEAVTNRMIGCFQDEEKYSCLSRNAVHMQREYFSREVNNLRLIQSIMGAETI